MSSVPHLKAVGHENSNPTLPFSLRPIIEEYGRGKVKTLECKVDSVPKVSLRLPLFLE